MTPELLALITAVLAIFNGETAPAIVAWLKKKLGIVGGWKATLLTLAEVGMITAGYTLLVTKNFTWGTFALATIYSFLRASGLYTEAKAEAKAEAANAKASNA
jgi:hypothetical protein